MENARLSHTVVHVRGPYHRNVQSLDTPVHMVGVYVLITCLHVYEPEAYIDMYIGVVCLLA